MDYLSGKEVKETLPTDKPNAKIPEVSNLKAFHALVVSLNENPEKSDIAQKCLRNLYHLDKMPTENSPARYCSPDTYTFAYLTMLIGDEKFDKNKDAKWWNDFWTNNKNNLVWNNSKGFYEVKR